MAKNKKVQRRIHVVEYTKKITQAMKMVSMAKLSALKHNEGPLQRYALAMEDLFQRTLQASSPQVLRAFCKKRAVKRILCLVVTSSRGLCGNYNNRVLQGLKAYDADTRAHHQEVTYLPIGQKVLQYLKSKALSYEDTYVKLSDKLDFPQAQVLHRDLLERFKTNQYQQIVLLGQNSMRGLPVYPRVLLPYPLPTVRQGEDLTIYEPHAHTVLHNLMILVLEFTLYKHLLALLITEHKTRIMAMGQSTDSAEELLKKLKTTYNRIRKASVTRDLIETTAGMTLSSS